MIEVVTSPIAYSVPCYLWDEETAKLVDNREKFAEDIGLLNENGVETLIVFCRSGDRSTSCVDGLDESLAGRFQAIYEIDSLKSGIYGFGGFEGSSYNQAYNGYRGFPGRLQKLGTPRSVSWKDMMLPVKIGAAPLVPE